MKWADMSEGERLVWAAVFAVEAHDRAYAAAVARADAAIEKLRELGEGPCDGSLEEQLREAL
jgi:hypothetical protein